MSDPNFGKFRYLILGLDCSIYHCHCVMLHFCWFAWKISAIFDEKTVKQFPRREKLLQRRMSARHRSYFHVDKVGSIFSENKFINNYQGRTRVRPDTMESQVWRGHPISQHHNLPSSAIYFFWNVKLKCKDLVLSLTVSVWFPVSWVWKVFNI